MIFGRRARERDLLVNYKRAFGTPEGKAVLKDLMVRFHVVNDHGGGALQEGQRSVVLHVMKTINMSLEQFDEAWKQIQEERKFTNDAPND